MKIKTKELTYDKVLLEPFAKNKKPKRPNIIFRVLMRLLSNKDLKKANFKYEEYNMDKIDKRKPIIVLMNHSSFIDLEIASKILFPRAYNIVCTDDGFVGKEWLMRNLGCIPTKKFITDPVLVRDILYSILLYPEASYTFDGTATPLPNYIGKFLHMAKVPVVMIKTEGAFLRDPLYNNLQVRDVNVSAKVSCILSKEEVEKYSSGKIYEIVKENFTFDNFLFQQTHHIEVKENFRADYLNRILYKCPHCMKEGHMKGEGINIKCNNCGETYTLSPYGYLKNINGNTIFSHIPSWYAWERLEVKKEIEEGRYKLDIDVDIMVMKNYKYVYKIGSGHLSHSIEGFKLVSFDNNLTYYQSPLSSYSLYSDYYWYEIGDMICIGDDKMRYYCFPKTKEDVVAKARLACEEIYKIKANIFKKN